MYSGVISIFSERIQKGLPITIYGDGQQTRDFVNVADVVQANLLAMGVQNSDAISPHQPATSNHQLSSGNFVALNVATGKQTSLLQLLEGLEELAGNKVEYIFEETRAGDIEHSLANISKVRNFLAYDPKVSLKDGLLELTK